MNIPLPPAAMTDSHSVHVVYPSLDTRTPNQHLQLPSVEAMLRELLMGWQANLAGQLLNIGAWGQIRGRTDDPSALRQIKQFLLEAPVRFAGSGLPHLVTLARRLDFDIHLYTTEQSTKDALGWLDFSEPHIRHLLRMGFDDALHHDCQKAGCLLRRGSSKASDPPADRSAPEARSSLP